MITFFVTPGALSGLHLYNKNKTIRYIKEGLCLPDNGGGHWLLHIVVECVTAFAGEDIIDVNGAVTLACSDVLVIPVESHAEGR